MNSSQTSLLVVRSPGRRNDRARRRRSSVSRGLNLADLQLQQVQRPPPTHLWHGIGRRHSEENADVDALPRYEANGGPPKYQERGETAEGARTWTLDPPQPQPPEMCRFSSPQPEVHAHAR
jgi:hypothetical protein